TGFSPVSLTCSGGELVPSYKVLQGLSQSHVWRQNVNPHPCGFYGDPLHECNCTPPLIQRYLACISGPLLDRIDLHIQVPAVKYKELAEDDRSEESAAIRDRILAARAHQFRRLEPFGIFCNAQMTPRTMRRFCKLDGESEKLMENAI